ncbi:MAG: hypothetical protein PHO28_03140 [Candidatus Pacebacteria bacterium]|nr:hypothetical protein [Candidatus Paceibacterota bacterium]
MEKILQEKNLESRGTSAIKGLLARIEKTNNSKNWEDQWVNWDDLGEDDPGWGDVSDDDYPPSPDDR